VAIAYRAFGTRAAIDSLRRTKGEKISLKSTESSSQKKRLCFWSLIDNPSDEAGSIYHAINRGNRRCELFHKPADYEAFLKLLGEGLEKSR